MLMISITTLDNDSEDLLCKAWYAAISSNTLMTLKARCTNALIDFGENSHSEVILIIYIDLGG